MKEIIYLVVSQQKVERMTKNLPQLSRGEIPVKVSVEVEQGAFRTPVIEKEITVNDWRLGIDLDDIEFKQHVITGEEADMIRERRIEKMRGILQENGYSVEKVEEDD